MSKLPIIIVMTLVAVVMFSAASTAQNASEQPVFSVSLLDAFSQGGVILYVLLLQALATFFWAVYLLMTMTVRREAPVDLARRAHAQIRAGELKDAYQMCQQGSELLARVLCAGIRMAGHDRFVIQEAMESEGERGATALWQRITYLSNSATLAPLLGLLGTVWGMMQAFGAVALDSAQVKQVAIAYHVSSAMITTAAGLMLAIPTLMVYYLLRGRVIKILATVEARASEFVEVIAEQGGE